MYQLRSHHCFQNTVQSRCQTGRVGVRSALLRLSVCHGDYGIAELSSWWQQELVTAVHMDQEWEELGPELGLIWSRHLTWRSASASQALAPKHFIKMVPLGEKQVFKM